MLIKIVLYTTQEVLVECQSVGFPNGIPLVNETLRLTKRTGTPSRPDITTEYVVMERIWDMAAFTEIRESQSIFMECITIVVRAR